MAAVALEGVKLRSRFSHFDLILLCLTQTVDIEGRKVDLRDVYNRLQAWERSPEGAAASAAAAAE